MENVSLDYANLGGVTEVYAIAPVCVRRVRTDYPSRNLVLELTSADGVIGLPMAAEGSFGVKEDKGRDFALGDYWDVDIEGVLPKRCGGVTDGLLKRLERGRWLVAVRDGNGELRLYGSKDVPLWFESVRDTGRQASDRNGVTFHFKGRQRSASIALDMEDVC